MRVKLGLVELNPALRPHIPHSHLIHNDLIIAAPDEYEHNLPCEELLRLLSATVITLNPTLEIKA